MVNRELIDYIRKNLESGFSKEMVKNELLRHGWADSDINEAFAELDREKMPNPIEHEKNSGNSKISKLKYGPVKTAISNLLLYGLGYLLLHKYRRFFAFFFLLLAAVVIFGVLGMLVSYLIVIIDTFRLSKKINDGVIKLPEKNNIMLAITMVFIIGITLFAFLPKHYFAFSVESCDLFYPMQFSDYRIILESISANADCKRMVRERGSLFEFTGDGALKDDACEAESYGVKRVCYFKKAIDTRNYKYCNYVSGYNSCLINLAGVLKDESLCEKVELQIHRCEEIVENCKADEESELLCKPTISFTCEGQGGLDESEKNECIDKYGLISE